MTKLRISAFRLLITVAAFLYAATCPLYSQETPTPSPTPAARTTAEEDPTKPILISIRDEYRNFRGGGWANTVIFRVDRLVLNRFGNRGGARGVILRFDLPFNTVHLGDVTQKGLGDLYAQALYIPRFRKNNLVAIGTGVVIPTATDRFLGNGKLILSPSIIPVWYFKNRERFIFLRIQNYISVAGDNTRPNINYLIVDPNLVHRVSERWWLAEDTEFKWDWHNRLSSALSGLQIGRMIKGSFGFWVKPEIAWGSGRVSDFNLKFTVFRLR